MVQSDSAEKILMEAQKVWKGKYRKSAWYVTITDVFELKWVNVWLVGNLVSNLTLYKFKWTYTK